MSDVWLTFHKLLFRQLVSRWTLCFDVQKGISGWHVDNAIREICDKAREAGSLELEYSAKDVVVP